MEIVLHIGTDKTGSTAIQNALSQNRAWFLSRSVYVPQTGFGRGNGHAVLLNRLDPDELGSLREELEDASAQGYSRTLLSWEGMVRFNRTQIRRLVSSLPPYPVRVLVYLREQAEVIQSGHLQWVKMSDRALAIGTIARPRSIFQHVAAFLFLRNPRRDYFRVLRKWERCIPGVRFSVRVFSHSTLHSGDIISDFLHQLGLAGDDQFLRGASVTNPSIDVEGTLLIERWRASGKPAREVESLIDVTQSVINRDGISTKYFLQESSVQALRRHFRRSNERLVRHFLHGEGRLFPELSRCWRTDDFGAIAARAEQLRQKVEEVNRVPTLTRVAIGAEIPSLVELRRGWNRPEPWGVWSAGGKSVIRFRIPCRRIIGEVDSLRLSLRGRYYGDNISTGVSVNGVDFSDQTLSVDCADLVIPLSSLYPNEVVEITLAHRQPARPSTLQGKSDNRLLAFGLMSIEYTLIKHS